MFKFQGSGFERFGADGLRVQNGHAFVSPVAQLKAEGGCYASANITELNIDVDIRCVRCVCVCVCVCVFCVCVCL